MKGKKVQSEKHYCYSHNLRAKRAGLKNNYIVADHYAMLEHFGDMCVYCGKEYPNSTDHIIPISKGGGSIRQNIAPCCRSCNSRKNISNWKEWFKNQDFFNEYRYSLIEKWLNGYEGEPLQGKKDTEIPLHERCYTPKEITLMFDKDMPTVMNWMKRGKIKAFRIGHLWRVTHESLTEFKEKKRYLDLDIQEQIRIMKRRKPHA